MRLYTDSDYTSQRVRVSRDKSNASSSNEQNAIIGASSYLGISAPARLYAIGLGGRQILFLVQYEPYDIREVNVLYDYLGYYTLTALWGSV